ncbi:MAG: glycosyl transferase family protein [Gemmatimonadetes bacterium]|nr:glycosyl transferase family protein [Gemmatimonadota bacterium]
MNPIRVAFTPIGGARWTGGYNYLVNLLSAIDRYESHRVRPVLFLGPSYSESERAPFLAMKYVDIVQSSRFGVSRSWSGLAFALATGRARQALRTFREYHIDVVFESATFYGWRFPIPTIAWLPDFQHRRMPEQFGTIGYWRRELGFRMQVASGRVIMLSSEDARRDAEQLYPGVRRTAKVVRFATHINPALMEAEPRHVLDRYDLGPGFFFLPNQFWMHKNHAIVIEALGILKQRGVNVIVAATGAGGDHRHPLHFERIKRRITELGLAQNFRLLGLIPRAHVVSLMRMCRALINPSFFEGWSSTVEEARALGVPMVLSSIAVHREQLGDRATYFAPDNASELAGHLEAMHGRLPASITPRTFDPAADENVRRFAANFVDTATFTLSRSEERVGG